MAEEIKRLFFGMEVQAPWPENFPIGRLLDEKHRHLTLAFLGNTEMEKIKEALLSFPQPNFKVGFAAKFDQCLFLPPRHPHVVAWRVAWLDHEADLLSNYCKLLIEWLVEKGLSPDRRHTHFLPHVTLARFPFNQRVWKKHFVPLPAMIKDIHLYESKGNLHYEPIWSYPLLAPFEEFEHTADLAYHIRGKNFGELFEHASAALCFHFPPLLSFLEPKKGLDHLEEVIMELNQLVTCADQAIGCPFKAVSFHSHLEKQENLLTWEMIVDV